MQELIKNAWLGWKNYTDGGKLAALFLAALLLLWLWNSGSAGEAPADKSSPGNQEDGRIARKDHGRIIKYATAMAVCCICPLSAALLMIYQTKFYDYQWIWSLVPVTIVIALAGTLLWTEFSGLAAKKHVVNPRTGKKKIEWLKLAGVTAVMLSVLYLCGSMGSETFDVKAESQKRTKTAQVLGIVTENGKNTDICLWAPKEIMEYARALDGRIRLPYGRNMWDISLNAYSYDTYGETEQLLYAWMSSVEETGEINATVEYNADMLSGENSAIVENADAQKHIAAAGNADVQSQALERVITAEECMALAQEYGINCILLPANVKPEALAQIEEILGVEAQGYMDYYMFCL